MTLPRWRSRIALFLGAVLCTGLIGCGSGAGDISGTITFKGAPLKGGNVTFASTDDGPSFSGPINDDGTYTVLGVRSGDYKVCVETESLKPSRSMGGGGPPAGVSKGGPPGKGSGPPTDPISAAKSGKIKTEAPEKGRGDEPPDVGGNHTRNGFSAMAEAAKNYIPIPISYSTPEGTDLKYTAGKGAQTFNFELKAK